MKVLGQIIRWLLVPVSAVAVIAGATAGGYAMVDLIDARCPIDSTVGGACVEAWHTDALEAVIHVAVFLAALGVVVVPSLVAPRGRRIVAASGALLAVASGGALYGLTGWGVLMPPLLLAAASAGLGVWWVHRSRRLHART